MKIYLATGNKNKKQEMSQILGRDYTIVTPDDENISFNPKETGSTFYENSMIKARALWNIVQAPVLADDSGLCVDILGGLPGVYSSRYAGPDFPQGTPDGKKISQDKQNCFLLAQTDAAIESRKGNTTTFSTNLRSCRYICSMVLLLNPNCFYIVQETMEGILVPSLKEAAGASGFGYDPLFFLPKYGKTVAQLSPEEKNAISHRGKAVRKIVLLINNLKKK